MKWQKASQQLLEMIVKQPYEIKVFAGNQVRSSPKHPIHIEPSSKPLPKKKNGIPYLQT
jgi:hypothetical protein